MEELPQRLTARVGLRYRREQLRRDTRRGKHGIVSVAAQLRDRCRGIRTERLLDRFDTLPPLETPVSCAQRRDEQVTRDRIPSDGNLGTSWSASPGAGTEQDVSPRGRWHRSWPGRWDGRTGCPRCDRTCARPQAVLDPVLLASALPVLRPCRSSQCSGSRGRWIALHRPLAPRCFVQHRCLHRPPGLLQTRTKGCLAEFAPARRKRLSTAHGFHLIDSSHQRRYSVASGTVPATRRQGSSLRDVAEATPCYRSLRCRPGKSQ